jgi:hypothetical protein
MAKLHTFARIFSPGSESWLVRPELAMQENDPVAIDDNLNEEMIAITYEYDDTRPCRECSLETCIL